MAPYRRSSTAWHTTWARPKGNHATRSGARRSSRPLASSRRTGRPAASCGAGRRPAKPNGNWFALSTTCRRSDNMSRFWRKRPYRSFFGGLLKIVPPKKRQEWCVFRNYRKSRISWKIDQKIYAISSINIVFNCLGIVQPLLQGWLFASRKIAARAHLL